MTPQIAVRDEQRLDIAVDREYDWLVLSADLPDATRSRAPWDALQGTAASPGSAKLVIAPAARTIGLRADVPAEDGIDVVARTREAREGMNRLAAGADDGADRLRQGYGGPPKLYARAEVPSYSSTDSRAGESGRTAEADQAPEIDLGALAAEAGWAFVQRASGRLAIDLGVPGQFHQAIVEPRNAGGCRARVELARLGDAADDTRTAIAVLLLTLAYVVRFVRAGAEPRDGTTSVFVEADIEHAATAPELHHALSALSVACRMAGREVKALMDPDVAHTYLAARGWAVSCTR
ncbi:MAG: hypothetical protein NT151_06650 [Acidobacteria bacterium]|nr:hypothetical protein [Acidobacteriota bacterium]